MKKKFLLLVLFFQLQVIWSQQEPNIIVFLVDDLGWVDTSVPFGDNIAPLNERYHTPNMERLANQGMKFTNAYATPVCTPTRVSMITGMNAAHHGVTNWTSPWKNTNTDREDEQMKPAPWNLNGLSPEKGIPNTIVATTLPELLKENGYFTVHVGKAHFAPAGTPGSNPTNLGFIVNIAGHSAGRPMSYLGEENYGNVPQKPYNIHAVPDMMEYYGTDTYLTKALTLEALEALETPIENKQPFFLNMAHYAIHNPYDPDERYLQKYLDAGLAPVEAIYASMIEGVDRSLGKIMRFLEKNNIEENTIILFMSDNGGLSLAPPRAGKAHTQNAPLRAGKGSIYEGGIRVPMIVKWPGVAAPASESDQPVIIEDFFPSIMEMAEIKQYETVQEMDGKSFVPILKNASFKAPVRQLIWHMPNKWIPNDGPGINYKSAIREGAWKLIYHMRNGKKELFNLELDISEATNLAPKYPDKVKNLSEKLGKHLRKWNAPMPIFRKNGETVPFPDNISLR